MSSIIGEPVYIYDKTNDKVLDIIPSRGDDNRLIRNLYGGILGITDWDGRIISCTRSRLVEKGYLNE